MDSITHSATPSHFSISNILSESWRLVKGSKWPVWFAFIVSMLIFMFIFAIGMLILAGIHVVDYHATMNQFAAEQAGDFWIRYFWPSVFLFIGVLIVSPLVTGIFLIGVKRARGQTVSATEGFAYFNRYSSLILTTLYLCILNFLVVGLIWGFFSFGHHVFGWMMLADSAVMNLVRLSLFILAIFLFLVLPLVADKNMNAFSAIATSCRKASTHWFKILLTWLLVGLIFVLMVFCAVILSFIFFGLLHLLSASDAVAKILSIFVGIALFLVSLIWFHPFYVIVNGVIYHKLIDE